LDIQIILSEKGYDIPLKPDHEERAEEGLSLQQACDAVTKERGQQSRNYSVFFQNTRLNRITHLTATDNARPSFNLCYIQRAISLTSFIESVWTVSEILLLIRAYADTLTLFHQEPELLVYSRLFYQKFHHTFRLLLCTEMSEEDGIQYSVRDVFEVWYAVWDSFVKEKSANTHGALKENRRGGQNVVCKVQSPERLSFKFASGVSCSKRL
jgi:hypothetical protein